MYRRRQSWARASERVRLAVKQLDTCSAQAVVDAPHRPDAHSQALI